MNPLKRKISDFEVQKRAKTKQLSLTENTESKGDGIFSNAEIHISSWNVNGLRGCLKKPNLAEYAAREELDILCLNETKLQDSHVPAARQVFSQFAYQYWNCSQTKKGYSGVGILSKVNPISVDYGIGIPAHDKEGRVITVEFKDFYIVSTYIPNAGQKLKNHAYRTEKWDIDFRQYLKNLMDKGKGVIWLGDLNVINEEIDIYDIKGKEHYAGVTPEERASFKETLEIGLTDSFRHLYPDKAQYSWYSTRDLKSRQLNRGWRLDYVVVNQPVLNQLKDSIIHDETMGSDHHPIEIILHNS